MKNSLVELFSRDLNKLRAEIQTYSNEATIWLVPAGISNSAGNLALHLCGNLQHFIGAVMGKSGYKRDREAEFGLKNVPREDIIKEIDVTLEIVHKTLHQLTDQALTSTYPLEVFGSPILTETFLIHLYGHLNYHLGQINYHRRILTE